MSVNNLGSALSRLDAVTRVLDTSLLHASSVDDVVPVDAAGIRTAADAVQSALGPTMPDGIIPALETLPIGATASFAELVTSRVALARLGAAAHGVAASGGPDAVALAGGLAAIDGASLLVRQRLHDDATGMLRAAGEVVEWGPARFTTEAAREEHVARLQAVLAVPDALMRASGGDTRGLAHRLPFVPSERSYYRRDLGRLEQEVTERLASHDAGVREPSDFATQNLAATRSAPVAMRAALGDVSTTLPPLPVDEQVTAGLTALDRHARILGTIIDLVGDAKYYDDRYRRAIVGADEHLGTALADLTIMRSSLAGGLDELRAAFASADAALADIRAYAAAPRRTPRNGQELLPTANEALADVAVLVRALGDSPQLRRIGTDAAEEVVEVLERRGPMDVAALRQVIDDAGAPLAARESLVTHVARLHGLANGAPASSVSQARQLLSEAVLIGEAALGAAARTDAEPKLLLNHATLVDAVQQVSARTAASLGVADQVPEAHGNQLRSGIDNLARRLGATPESPSYEQPEPYLLDTLLKSIRAFDTALATRVERSRIDGGLRAIAPSDRPKQAFPAEVNWLLRELDQLPPVGADAPSELHVDAAVRRLSTMADLLDTVSKGSRGVDDATRQGLRSAVTGRVRSELATQDDLWRFPDDVARSLTEVGRRLEPNSDEAFRRAGLSGASSPADRLRTSAASLRAWSMLQDGALPATAIDRIAVGDRRASALSTAAATVPKSAYDNPRPQLHAWLHGVEVRLADLDATLGLQMPAAERAAIDEAIAAVRTYSDDVWEQRVVGADPTIDVSVVEPARHRIDELTRAIADIHAQLRSARSGEATW